MRALLLATALLLLAPAALAKPYAPEVEELLGVAETAMDAKRYEQAWENYREAAEACPNDEAIAEAMARAQALAAAEYVATGKAHLAARRYTEALYAFESALDIQPGDAAATRGQQAARKALNSR